MTKSSDEIMKGLECDPLALIRQLYADNCRLKDELYNAYNVQNEQLVRINQLEAERDAAVDEMPRWNNVSDKLPFYNTTVLCIDIDNKHVFIGNMLTCHLYQNKGAMCCAVQGLHGVRYATYWMPLPEPPKEATNDQ